MRYCTPSNQCIPMIEECPLQPKSTEKQISHTRETGCPVNDQCQIGIKGVGFIVIAEYLTDYFFEQDTVQAALTDGGGNHVIEVSPERPCVITLINYQHRQFNMTLTGRSLAAYMLRIRYPAWQDFTELKRDSVQIGNTTKLQVQQLHQSDNRLEEVSSTAPPPVDVYQIKDIPITIQDDVTYLYIGSTSQLRGHNVTINLQWVKNLPLPYLGDPQEIVN
ncbi:hypothetical protein FGO68_gene6529 [Halteria grandinella]|uniref:Uncharacterized protein n=1 Tax=Halteria grandinella TaxID=5974 RepID=A0A8J8NMD6_HALGN|nr:hypothetical protein FGO68_gene6529 [Halteria grandinella]